MNAHELPRADERRCTACGDCLRVCPTHCLRIVHFVPVVTQELACIRCGVCIAACPAAALSVAAPAW
jgi:NAD-dependent dihydropyrimidine dehydrogenase PreA subunit